MARIVSGFACSCSRTGGRPRGLDISHWPLLSLGQLDRGLGTTAFSTDHLNSCGEINCCSLYWFTDFLINRKYLPLAICGFSEAVAATELTARLTAPCPDSHITDAQVTHEQPYSCAHLTSTALVQSLQLHYCSLMVHFIDRKCWKNYEPRRPGKPHDWQKLLSKKEHYCTGTAPETTSLSGWWGQGESSAKAARKPKEAQCVQDPPPLWTSLQQTSPCSTPRLPQPEQTDTAKGLGVC